MRNSFAFILLFFSFCGFSQQKEFEITLGSSEIALNQTFFIKLTATDTRIQEYGDFPDIPGFNKRGTSTETYTQFINGNRMVQYSVLMVYSPSKEGTFELKPFKISVNNSEVSSSGTTIKVGPAIQSRRTNPLSRPFDDPFQSPGGSNQQEFIEVEDDVSSSTGILRCP